MVRLLHLAVVHLLLGLVVSNVISISPHCEAYPKQRVLVTSVSNEYIDFFVNWLHHAGPYLSDIDHLTVLAEDDTASERLTNILSVQPKSRQFEVIEAFKVNITKIPDQILMFLEMGCTTLYFASDSAWKNDGPLLALERNGVHDLLLTWQVPPRSVSPAFMYVQPTKGAKTFMSKWAEVWDEPGIWDKNQKTPMPVPEDIKPATAMNKAMWTPSYDDLDYQFMAFREFPIANWAERNPHLTCLSAYTYFDSAKKVELFKNMSSWSVPDKKDAKLYLRGSV